MLDSLAPNLPPAGRNVADKPGEKATDTASAGFAGLLNLDSLPELPLQAHLPDVDGGGARGAAADLPAMPDEFADTPAGTDVVAEIAPGNVQHGAWVLVQTAGNAALAEPLSASPDAAIASADVDAPGSAAIGTARSVDVAPALASSASSISGSGPELPVDAAQAAQAADTPAPDVDAVLADAQALTDDAGEGEVAFKSMNVPASSSNPGAAPMPGIAPATAMSGTTSALPQAQPGQSVPVADLAEHALATIRHQGADQAEVRMSLHPAELGALDLQIEQDGKRLELNITVDSDAARRAVNEHIASLRERLGDAGMQLARLDVSVRDQGQRQNADTPTPSTHSDHDEGVNISPQRLIAVPADGLDLYA